MKRKWILTWVAGLAVVMGRDGGDLARTRRLGLARFERAVRTEILRRGKKRPCRRIVAALFAALGPWLPRLQSTLGNAVLDVVIEEDLQCHALGVGDRLLEGLRSLMDRYPVVGDVRGSGLFLGVETHPVQFGDAVDEHGHGFPEFVADVLDGEFGVLYRVVQYRRNDRLGIEVHFGE